MNDEPETPSRRWYRALDGSIHAMTKTLSSLFATITVAAALAACSGAAGDQVASLTETTSTVAAESASSTEEESALFVFAQCMRDQGLEDFADPIIDGDGKVEFPSKAADGTKDQFEPAFATCSPFLAGTSLGADKGGDEAAEAVDRLVAFSECMRGEGFDMPDPDADASFPDFDKESAEFEVAWEACGAVFEGSAGSDK